MSELTQNRGYGWLMVARVTVEAAAAFFVTAALLNYGVTCSAIGSRIADWQPVAAVMALALPVLAFWLAITLMFGRIFCSTLCPMGALTDLLGRLRSPGRPFRFHKPLTPLRTAAFILFLLLLILAPAFASAWLDPYGLYATMLKSLTSGRVYAATFVCAALLGVMTVMAFRRGRLFCNTLCPLSAPLGFFGRRAAFHIDINTDLCIQCRKCADACKAECINLNDHVADMSRCIVCFNCLPVCPNNAISYTLNRHTLSTPLMQKINSLTPDKSPTIASSCNNTSTSCATSSTTEPSKPTEPAPAP